jgi:hypothetical protein
MYGVKSGSRNDVGYKVFTGAETGAKQAILPQARSGARR